VSPRIKVTSDIGQPGEIEEKNNKLSIVDRGGVSEVEKKRSRSVFSVLKPLPRRNGTRTMGKDQKKSHKRLARPTWGKRIQRLVTLDPREGEGHGGILDSSDLRVRQPFLRNAPSPPHNCNIVGRNSRTEKNLELGDLMRTDAIEARRGTYARRNLPQ